MKSVEFTLREPVQHSPKGGEFKTFQILQLTAPNLGGTLTKKNARRLRDLGLSAVVKLQALQASQPDGEQPEGKQEGMDEALAKEKETPGRTLVEGLAASGVDTNQICEAMKALAPTVITIEDTEDHLSHLLWEKLDMKDQDEITGAYITAFLI